MFIPFCPGNGIINGTSINIFFDSWPSILDQSRACKDWGWNPNYDFDNAFEKYLIPKITEFYKK